MGYKKYWRKGLVLLVIGLLAFGVTLVTAATPTEIDLTTDVSDMSVTINGAIFEKFDIADAAGTGVFDTFLKIQNSPVQKGYNSDYRPVQFNEGNSKNVNHSIPLKNVPVEVIDGTAYREFQLDVNQVSNDPSWYLSLDKFQVWLTNNPNITGYNLGSYSFDDAHLVYDMDKGDGPVYLKLDYRLNPGSGKRDYRVLVPQSNFAGASPGYDYVVLFAEHGNFYPANDGFEEWGVRVVKFGELKVTKAFTGYPAGYELPNEVVIEIEGPSYGYFADGEGIVVPLNAGNHWTFEDDYLIPGSYTVKELDIPGWSSSYSPSQTVVVEYDSVSEVNVTNTLDLGCLEINKFWDYEGVVGFDTDSIPASIDINIQGPSYPAPGLNTYLYKADGWTETWCDLIPGTYTVSEPSLGVLWSVEVTGDGMVAPGETAVIDITNTYIPQAKDETAWAYHATYSITNNSLSGTGANWGWTNQLTTPGSYTLTLYAGAGQNDITKGFPVGTVTVTINGSTIDVLYEIDTELDTEYTFTEAHLWVGETPLPPSDRRGRPDNYTSAPGQFPYRPDISPDGKTAIWSGTVSQGTFYVAAHAVVEWYE